MAETKARFSKPSVRPGKAQAPGRAVRSVVVAQAGCTFLLVFAAVATAHWPLLRLPYYWDEAGYYIPAAYDLLRSGTLIPYSTLSNAHPPLPSLYLAGWWKVFGFSPLATRTAMSLVTACALLAVYRLARGALRSRGAGAAVAGLTALYPVWFVQSTLAHADLMAAAGTLWGICLLCEQADQSGGALALEPTRAPAPTRRLLAIVACFALAALAKEIAIGTPLALAAWEGWLALRGRRAPKGSASTTLEAPPRSLAGTPRAAAAWLPSVPAPSIPEPSVAEPSPAHHLQTAGALLLPVLPLAAWFAYHRWRTGFLFGNPEYLRYNATATLNPVRILLALGHRLLHLTAHLNLFVPVLVTLGCLLLPTLPGRIALPASTRARLLVVLLANWIFFSVLGGALLTRYLLPAYPLILLLCVAVWRRHLRYWQPVALLTAAAFVLGLVINPPYRFSPEDTLAYRDSILLEQAAIAQIELRYGRPTVLTAWPATDALTRPELGYLANPLPVVAIDNFSADQVSHAQQLVEQALRSGREPYTVALVFSTKIDPPASGLPGLAGSLGARGRQADERYFDFHYDLPPAAVARLLGGTVVWQAERHSQVAAVLHFDRAQLALDSPLRRPAAAASRNPRKPRWHRSA